MIRRSPKLALCACCTAVAVVVSGAVAMSGTGAPAATPVSLTAQKSVIAEVPAVSQEWNLNGANSVDVGYDGMSFVYSITFVQNGSSLTGTLDDSYYPTSGPISGTIDGDSVTFTFDYPSGSIQGTRTYTGTISQSGAVAGTWTQTGDESPDNGTWTLASNAVPGSTSPPPATPTPSPSPTCEAADNETVVTEYAGLDALPELFTDKVTFSWCADSDSQPQIFSSSQSSNVEESGFSLSGILLVLDNTAGLTFAVTPATAPDPTIDNGSGSASTTASGLAFNETINLGQDLVALIPSGLVARVGLRLLPLLRSGQLVRLSTQLSALWATAVATIAAALTKQFGLPAWVADLLADFGLDKLVDAVKDHAEEFVAQATTSLAALGRHPTLTSVVNALESAIKTAAGALTFTTKLWGPQINVTLSSGQTISVDDQTSYVGLWVDVQRPVVTPTPAS